MKDLFKNLLSSFNAPLHVVLKRFKIIQILVLLFFVFLTWDMTLFYKGIALELLEWQVAPMFAYLTALIAAVKFCFQSIKDKDDEE